jgi:SAM-dependent methyltransferase
MHDRDAADWEELARREPYFPVHTHEGRLASDEFFATGEADVVALLSGVTAVLGREIALTSVLDFGCGAGRLTLPLARRARDVVACDLAPTMLLHARTNAEDAGLQNVTFVSTADLPQVQPASFDFIVSLLVLQYIAPPAGYALIRTMTALLAPGGVAALHVMLDRAGELHRLMRWSRSRSRLAIRRPAYEHVRSYDANAIRREVEAGGGVIAAQLPLPRGGVVLVIDSPEGSVGFSPPGSAKASPVRRRAEARRSTDAGRVGGGGGARFLILPPTANRPWKPSPPLPVIRSPLP